MKYIATLLTLASIAAASPALAFEVTDHTGITTSIASSDYGMSLSNNAIGNLVGNQHVYGFATFGYAHNDRSNLDTVHDNATSPQATGSVMSVVGIKYRF